MKKIIFLFALLLLSISCNDCNKCNPCTVVVTSDDNTTNSNSARTTPICIDLVEYERENTVEKKAEWLRKYGKAVCEETLFSAIEKSHLIGSDLEIDIKNKRTFSLPWEEIVAFIGETKYNAYIGFNQDFSNLILKPKFESLQTSFSAPLFKHLQKKFDLQPYESIVFIHNARVGNREKDVIKIQKKAFPISYYDYSDDPKLTMNSKPL